MSDYEHSHKEKKETLVCPYGQDKDYKKKNQRVTVTRRTMFSRKKGDKEWRKIHTLVHKVSCPFFSEKGVENRYDARCSNYVPPFIGHVSSCAFTSDIKKSRWGFPTFR